MCGVIPLFFFIHATQRWYVQVLSGVFICIFVLIQSDTLKSPYTPGVSKLEQRNGMQGLLVHTTPTQSRSILFLMLFFTPSPSYNKKNAVGGESIDSNKLNSLLWKNLWVILPFEQTKLFRFDYFDGRKQIRDNGHPCRMQTNVNSFI